MNLEPRFDGDRDRESIVDVVKLGCGRALESRSVGLKLSNCDYVTLASHVEGALPNGPRMRD